MENAQVTLNTEPDRQSTVQYKKKLAYNDQYVITRKIKKNLIIINKK